MTRTTVIRGKKRATADVRDGAVVATNKGNRRWVKLVAAIACGVVLFAGGVMAGCQPGGGNEAVIAGVVDCLEGMTDDAPARIDAQLRSIEPELKQAQEEVAKLEQAADPAFAWLELQMTRTFKKGGTWQVTMHPQWLAELKNDRYQITRLEFIVQDAGTEKQQYFSTVKVIDLATRTEYDCVALDSQLREQLSALEKRWRETYEAKEQSTSTLDGVLARQKKWVIQKVDDNTCSVSGPGLGWKEKFVLTTGEWLYHKDSGELEPVDGPSQALQRVLSGEL